MRVSVTLSDEDNVLITKVAKEHGISKDKLIGDVVTDWLNIHKTGRLKPKVHNERGAGRKQQYGEAHKLAMKAYRADGVSYRDIATIYGCSVGTVCRLVNEE